VKLKILLPTHIFLETEARKVNAEGLDGFFCLLPRHRDFVTALATGILSYVEKNGEERHLAVMEGTLVKKDDEVLVATRRATGGENLETLHDTVENEFKKLEEKEKKMRTAAARIEAGFIRRFLEFQHYGR
jgi:F-type H+-transporting ATPase subunit epsilon